jgi:glycosyltransferase involved in cell wall biosynthesis
MGMQINKNSHFKRILIVGPAPPPYGGVALQGMLLRSKLREEGFEAEVLGYNRPFAPAFRICERIPGLRTLLRTARLASDLCTKTPVSGVVHILACSWLYFFIVVTPAVLIARLYRKRIVLNYRAGNADDFLRACGWVAKPIFQMASAITVPSDFLARVIQRRLGLSVSIVPNILDFSNFRYRARHTFRPKFLVTRHLEEIYDVESVLHAFAQIQDEYPMASLSIAGTGTQEARLRNLVRELNLSNVHFLGYVPHDRLPEVYDKCDILLNGSRVDNFPGSLLEASAAGLVIVSTDAGGIPFIYQNEKTALLVPVGDSQRLASGALRVLRDQALAQRLASSGLEICRQCDWIHVRESLFAGYDIKVDPPDFSPQCREAELENRMLSSAYHRRPS